MTYAYADEIREDLLRMIPADGRIIGSIGCGTGATEGELVKQGRQVHGVDIAPEAIAMARVRLSTARLIEPANHTPFDDASLDGLILADVIEHLPEAWMALKLYVKAVKPGGWVVISTPNMRSVKVITKFFVGGDWPEEKSGIFDSTHLQVMTRKRLIRWCDQAGLHIERWFDKYESRRYPWADWATLKLFHAWFTYQLQVLCRR